jgi:CPA1 family monovalent cation:H+ antiporter
LLYSAAWNTSWSDFWRNKRPISLLAFGLVIFTSATVALVSNLIIPDFPIAYGFLLGGIISPPDAIAATSVLQGLKIPKRMISILEGESLINDASSLIVFRFALVAILTGHFNFGEASKDFVLVVVMGIVIGLVIANIIYFIHRFFPTTPDIDTAITLISPYFMYITAEHFDYSGVLSVVCGGLFLSYRSQEIFSYETRISAAGLWSTLTFLLNGFVFILIGLQLPGILSELGNYSIWEAIGYALIISLLTIIIRIIWVFPGAYLPRFLFRSIRENEPRPTERIVFLVAWSGMRGVVSLASALAIPLTLDDGSIFPHRNLILFITFVVILVTLVLQGLSLKPLIKLLKVEVSEETEKTQDLDLRIQLAETVLTYMEINYSEHAINHEAYKRVKERYERMIEMTKRKLDSAEAQEEDNNFRKEYRQMLIELVQVRRLALKRFRYAKQFNEDLIREREWELDLEEARLRN